MFLLERRCVVEHGPVQSYRDLTVWKKSIALVTEVYRISRMLPPEERFGVVPQLRRAAVSVASNIAEGHGSSHTNTFLRHLAIARGSLMEVESLLYVAEVLREIGADALYDIRRLIEDTSRLITALRRALQRHSTAQKVRKGRGIGEMPTP